MMTQARHNVIRGLAILALVGGSFGSPTPAHGATTAKLDPLQLCIQPGYTCDDTAGWEDYWCSYWYGAMAPCMLPESYCGDPAANNCIKAGWVCGPC